MCLLFHSYLFNYNILIKYNKQYNQNEHKFNDYYSINNLPKIKDETYEINLNEYKSIGIHWMLMVIM